MLPSTLISTFRSGDWTLTYFLLVPEVSKLSNKFTMETPNTRSTVIQSQDSQEMWVGAGIARYLSASSALGLTMQLIQRTERMTSGVIFEFPTTADTGTVSNQYQDLSAYSLSFTLGFLHHLSDVATLGLRVQTPSFRIAGKGKAYRGSQTVDAGTLTNESVSEDEVRTQYTLPLDVSVGSRFQVGARTSILADVSFQAATDFVALESPSFNERIRTDGTFRFSTGVLHQTSDKFEIGCGFLLNPSAIHDLGGRDAGDSRLTFFGITAGFFWKPDNVRTGLAFFHLRGSGEVIPAFDTTTPAELTGRITGAALTISYLL